MTSTNVNFSLVKKVQEAFSLIISDFSLSATMLFNIAQKIQMTAVLSLASLMVAPITIKKIVLTFSALKLTEKPVLSIVIKRIQTSYVFSETLKMIVAIYKKLPLTFIMNERQKIVSNISLKKISLALNLLIASFYTLGTHDPKTLGTMDVSTLGDLDYVLV